MFFYGIILTGNNNLVIKMEKLERLLTQLINSHNKQKKLNLSFLLGQRKVLHSLSP